MPKAIDHDQRRSDIIDVTWRLIVKGGLQAATMREIAAEAGFANGALKHYFPGKDDIITGAYQRAMAYVLQRVAESMRGLTGFEAFQAQARASMPFDQESRDAARVLLAFWEQGFSSAEISESYKNHLAVWHEGLGQLIAVSRAEGSIRTSMSDAEIIDEFILLNVGATALSAVAGEYASDEVLERLLESFFERLQRADPVG